MCYKGGAHAQDPMFINITGAEPGEYWKRAVLLSTLATMDDNVYPSTFRGIAERMLMPMLEFQAHWDDYFAAIALREHSREPIEELPGRPSPAHMVETLYSDWGPNCLGRNFWIETWKRRCRRALSDGMYVVCSDADSDEEKEALNDICEHPIAIDAGDQRFKEGLSYFPHTENGAIMEQPSLRGFKLLSVELHNLFCEHALRLTK